MSKRFIIAGGGTGGHIFPAIAIAQAIRKMMPLAEFLFVGAKGKMEMEKVPQSGFKIVGLDIAGFNRKEWFKNILLPYQLMKSFLQVRRIVHEFKPDAVIGVGGYSTYPVLRWAQFKNIPTFIHEANAFAGKSNQLLAKKALKIFTGTSGMERFFPAQKTIVTGNPVRQSIAHLSVDRAEALAGFGLEAHQTTLLIIGGSLGAVSINRAVAAGINRLQSYGIQLIWQTGKPFINEAKSVCSGLKGVWVNDFIQDMHLAYAAADLLVSRAGAMSVAEIALAGKPAIFIPYPFAAEDHQTSNALHLVNRDAALLIPDREAAQKLIDQVIALAGDHDKRSTMKNNLLALAVKDADEHIAKEIIKQIGS
ncbi:MAG: undecaprenyldiphospho-muramoylpentapeptide beta-N-acetylglucosaminyltransferase [Bacteroidetes bacterium]|nr:undecaprenyldiphospho-muramoylpentapeptide beta-N-acetylglucosaminyltransferase [Bacteroidota bacterium]